VSGSAETRTDGRVLRGQRNTQAILDALLDLYRQGTLTPTLTEVAQAAGVTTRAVYHRFPDIEAIAREVGRRQIREHRAHFYSVVQREGPVHERIVSFVEARMAMYERIAPVRRAAMVNLHRSDVIREQLRFAWALGRQQIEQTFDNELTRLDEPARKQLLESLDVLTSFECWDRMRTRQQLNESEVRAILVALLTGALGTVRLGVAPSAASAAGSGP
jgi:TetR/AcrR family transcriptional regulator, regulator of autoinduction and epiphytic fitness